MLNCVNPLNKQHFIRLSLSRFVPVEYESRILLFQLRLYSQLSSWERYLRKSDTYALQISLNNLDDLNQCMSITQRFGV